jgi:NAD+ kinase
VKKKKMLPINKALIFSKLTRIAGEARRLNLPIQSQELEQELFKRGFHVPTLRKSHDSHMRSLESVIEAFLRAGISTRLEQARTPLSSTKPVDEDLVVSVGGDGTVLEASRYVGSKSAFLGVNSDPELSTGRLCTFAYHPNKKFDDVLDRLRTGSYSWLLRQRLGAKLTHNNSIIDDKNKEHTTIVPVCALNEMFFAERDAYVPTKHSTLIEDSHGAWCLNLNDPHHPNYHQHHHHHQHQQPTIQRSCGVIVCTGSGSTAWVRSASATHPRDVQHILQSVIPQVPASMVRKTTVRLNEECVFHPEANHVGYVVREPITPYQSAEGSFGPYRGFARKVVLRSMGYDILLTVDGTYSIEIPYGMSVEMKIDLDRPLRCIIPNAIL